MILNYYGHPSSLSTCATLGTGGIDGPNGMKAPSANITQQVREYVAGPGGTWVATFPNRTYFAIQIARILEIQSDNAVNSELHGALTQVKIEEEIDDREAPMVIRYQWFNAAGNPAGGHFAVVYGTNGGVHNIHDPWFGSYNKTHAALLSSAGGNRVPVQAGLGRTAQTNDHSWTHTLTTTKAIDLLILFDTTGSMGPYISNMKANAISILNNLKNRFKDYRVAVADYKDYPQHPWGESSDYVYQARQAFTDDIAAAQAAINSLSASGGNDIPESVFSALWNAALGTGIGTWREDPVKRLIILIADAPGHDPEPYPGGKSSAQSIALLAAPPKPISVHSLLAGPNLQMTSQLSRVAAATGGSATEVAGSDVSTALQNIIQAVDENPRFPAGVTAALLPRFQFEPVGEAGMGNGPASTFLELQGFVPKTGKWRRAAAIAFRDPTTASYLPKRPIKLGNYRWRMGYKTKRSTAIIPALNAPATTPASTVVEDEWTEFERVLELPAGVGQMTRTVNPDDSRVATYSFLASPNAASYAVEILQDGKVWRKLKVRQPVGGGLIQILVRGHKAGSYYSWRVQGLNFDRPKPDSSAWQNQF